MPNSTTPVPSRWSSVVYHCHWAKRRVGNQNITHALSQNYCAFKECLIQNMTHAVKPAAKLAMNEFQCISLCRSHSAATASLPVTLNQLGLRLRREQTPLCPTKSNIIFDGRHARIFQSHTEIREPARVCRPARSISIDTQAKAESWLQVAERVSCYEF